MPDPLASTQKTSPPGRGTLPTAGVMWLVAIYQHYCSSLSSSQMCWPTVNLGSWLLCLFRKV